MPPSFPKISISLEIWHFHHMKYRGRAMDARRCMQPGRHKGLNDEEGYYYPNFDYYLYGRHTPADYW
jgi:hypothetical protein